MEKKINIAELLKDCPKGMELDCTMFENVTFEKVVTEIDCDGNEDISIIVVTHYNDRMVDEITLTEYGTYTYDETAKCVIFPKGKTTWEGFVPPCKFKDGDVISVIVNKNLWYGIYQKEFHALLYCYVSYSDATETIYPSNSSGLCLIDSITEIRLATEEEKQKLFDAIKANSYKWNPETKTLEKLRKFKVGDKIKHKCEKFRDERTIVSCGKSGYWTSINDWIDYKNQDDWELVPNKFDITTLKPFDKVLVRTDNERIWSIQFFERSSNRLKKAFRCMGGVRYRQCIPFEGNEHLLNTANDCDSFFKVWE